MHGSALQDDQPTRKKKKKEKMIKEKDKIKVQANPMNESCFVKGSRAAIE